MADQVVTNITVGQKYRMSIRRSDTKGIDGFTVEANGDDILAVETDVACLYDKAKNLTTPTTITMEVK